VKAIFDYLVEFETNFLNIRSKYLIVEQFPIALPNTLATRDENTKCR